MAKDASPVIETSAVPNTPGSLSAFSEAWEVMTKNTNLVIPVVVVALASTLLSLAGSLLDVDALSSLGSIVGIYTNWLALWGFLQIARGVKTIDLAKQAQNFGAFIQYFVTSLVVGLLIGIGFILLIVPGIYLALKYGFAMLLTIDEGLGVGAAMERSSKMTEGRKMNLLGFMVVSLIINIVGAMLLGLGLLITIPVTMLAYTILYLRWKN
jgi:uncharacterized membrane protein